MPGNVAAINGSRHRACIKEDTRKRGLLKRDSEPIDAWQIFSSRDSTVSPLSLHPSIGRFPGSSNCSSRTNYEITGETSRELSVKTAPALSSRGER